MLRLTGDCGTGAGSCRRQPRSDFLAVRDPLLLRRRQIAIEGGSPGWMATVMNHHSRADRCCGQRASIP